MGAKYSLLRSKNQTNQVQITYPDGGTETGFMQHNNTYPYIGPVVSTRFVPGNGQLILLANYSLGYLGYKSEANIVGRNIMQTGKTVGFSGDLGLDYLPKSEDNIALGVNFSYILGALSQYQERHGGNSTTVELSGDERLNLSRIEIAGGLKLYF